MAEIPEKLYYKIGEVAGITKVKPYVLRYWESEFRIISPRKSLSKHRVYTRRDIELILEIKKLLYKEKYTLEGAKKRIRELQSGNSRDGKGGREMIKAAIDQLRFPFGEAKYVDALKSIKKELSSLRELLAGRGKA